ncbi:MAG: methionine adenosyltransferase [Gammaproteobacteria bacterium]|nr:methionine adenosyltransferase [Gammaproteobacteria bacterium]
MLFTSESVSPGHPDKVADQISDAILDLALAEDFNAKVAVECLVKEGLVVLAGEMTTSGWVDVQQAARQVIQDVGYVDPNMGFDYRACGVLSVISQQSKDIANGTAYQESEKSIGAGDQGLMFGYACLETEHYMPAPIYFSHLLMQHYVMLRQSHSQLWPDAKAQVTVEYHKGKITGIHDVVVSCQHRHDVELDELRALIERELIRKVLPAEYLQNTRFLINPAGRFVEGGPQADCGLTGRKIIVDTYGGYARHGGGCFSGKDPSKVDRSAAYMARFLAKNIVAHGLAERCEVQLAYAIGFAKPVSLFVNTFSGDEAQDQKIEQKILSTIDLTPSGIIDRFELRRPIYRPTATFGHFGRPEFPWEQVSDSVF